MNIEDFEKAVQGLDSIIFDYGGIFVDIHHSRSIDRIKAKSAIEGVEKLYGKNAQSKIFDQLEVGQISGDSFLNDLKKASGFRGEKEELKDAWCAMLGDHPWQRLEYIKTLSGKFRLFMLSNINEIHEAFLLEKIEKDPKLAGFFDSFEKVYFSHHIGLRKPSLEAFELILNENDLDPEKTAFVDDTPGHVASATKLGLRGIHLDPPNTFVFP